MLLFFLLASQISELGSEPLLSALVACPGRDLDQLALVDLEVRGAFDELFHERSLPMRRSEIDVEESRPGLELEKSSGGEPGGSLPRGQGSQIEDVDLEIGRELVRMDMVPSPIFDDLEGGLATSNRDIDRPRAMSGIELET